MEEYNPPGWRVKGLDGRVWRLKARSKSVEGRVWRLTRLGGRARSSNQERSHHGAEDHDRRAPARRLGKTMEHSFRARSEVCGGRRGCDGVQHRDTERRSDLLRGVDGGRRDTGFARVDPVRCDAE